jgi:hypothetical protein
MKRLPGAVASMKAAWHPYFVCVMLRNLSLIPPLSVILGDSIELIERIGNFVEEGELAFGV